MRKPATLFVLALGISFSAACGGDEESLPKVDCDAGAVPTYTQLKTTTFAKCTSCHSSTVTGTARQDAPPGVNFDTYAAAKAEAKDAAHEVDEGSMPPENYPDPSEEEKQALYKWAQCGTPE